MNYEQDIRIDENALDIEWLDQPQLMIKYAIHAAKAKLERDRKSVELDLVKADLDRRIRTKPEKFGIAKITEAAVTNTILGHSEYKEIQDEYMQLKYEADIAQAAVNAFDARKTALENMVKLHGQQYFAGPRVPRELSREREIRQSKVDSNIASKLQRRNR
mgnify:CR=1 FL=1